MIQRSRQSSIVFEKPGIQFENLKTLKSSNYPTVQYVLLKNFLFAAQVFCLPMSTKGCVGYFFIPFRSGVSCKNLERPGFYTLVFYTFINNSSLNKIKKISHTLLQTLLSRKYVQISEKKIKLCGSWSSSKFSIFQTKNLVSWK